MKVFKKHERGSVLLYVAGSLMVMMLFVGLAIDGGWTTYVRNQGQAAVDAAALSAASAITGYKRGSAASTIELQAAAFAQNAASAGSANIVIHQSPTLTLGNNIDCLTYDQTNNTVTCSDPGCGGTCAAAQVNAVRVSMEDSATPSRTSALNIPLFFGRLVGMPFMRLNVSAVGYVGCPGTCAPSTCGPELPVGLCANYVGYPDKCGPTHALQAPDGTDNSGFTSFFDSNTTGNACRDYVNSPSTIPASGVGQSLNVTNGQVATCLSAIKTKFDLNKDASGKWCVFMPVFNCPGGAFNGALPVAGFAQMCITKVVDTGSPKYIQGFLNCDVSVNSGPSGGACFGVSATNPIVVR